MSETDPDAAVLSAWRDNAAAWIEAIDNGEIRSRVTVTNRAIVEAVAGRAPSTVLDIGCGEGWLARGLSSRGIAVTGVDALPELVESARSRGGDFLVCSYASIAEGTHGLDRRFQAAVCNFSLIGGAEVDRMLGALPGLLDGPRLLFIQTLHPAVACGDAPYRDGWREGSWAGFSSRFTTAPPWYFRTLESWVRLLGDSGFRLLEVREPVSTETGKPVSMIFVSEATTEPSGANSVYPVRG